MVSADQSYNWLVRTAETDVALTGMPDLPLFVVPLEVMDRAGSHLDLPDELQLPFDEQLVVVGDNADLAIVSHFEKLDDGWVRMGQFFEGGDGYVVDYTVTICHMSYEQIRAGGGCDVGFAVRHRIGDRWEDVPKRLIDNEAIDVMASLAVQGLTVLMAKNNFVVEEVNEKERDRQARKGKKLPRYHQRERLMVLSKEETVRRLYRGTEHEAQAAERTPHMRRGHWATLRSDYYVNKKGKSVWRKACWVGPEENKQGNVRYKVRLDL